MKYSACVPSINRVSQREFQNGYPARSERRLHCKSVPFRSDRIREDPQPIGKHEPLFALGQFVATANALSAIPEAEMRAALVRHANGDWGNLCEHDKLENALSLQHGWRLLSAYETADGTKFWIITEADRSVTTVLLPEDY